MRSFLKTLAGVFLVVGFVLSLMVVFVGSFAAMMESLPPELPDEIRAGAGAVYVRWQDPLASIRLAVAPAAFLATVGWMYGIQIVLAWVGSRMRSDVEPMTLWAGLKRVVVRPKAWFLFGAGLMFLGLTLKTAWDEPYGATITGDEIVLHTALRDAAVPRR